MRTFFLTVAAILLGFCFFFGGIFLIPLSATFGLVWAAGALLTLWVHRRRKVSHDQRF